MDTGTDMSAGIEVGEGTERRRIACLDRTGSGPAVVWFGGFRSEMRATKAEALDAWAAERGRAFFRFDYSGHGASGGRFEDGTISRWLEDALAAIAAAGLGPALFVGSSMGAWIATLAALRLRGRSDAPLGLVLLAPALDFTERLMWASFPPDVRTLIETEGSWDRPSDDGEPYPITRALIADGRQHLVLDGMIETGCPVHVVQGMRDVDVPWEHAMLTVERLPGEDVQITLVKDGDHRLSRPEDIGRMVRAIEGMLDRVGPARRAGTSPAG